MSKAQHNYSLPSPAQWSGKGVTAATGRGDFVFPAGMFSAPPVLSVGLEFSSGGAVMMHRIASVTATGCSIQVVESVAVTVLSDSVLAATVNKSGVTVHMNARAAN